MNCRTARSRDPQKATRATYHLVRPSPTELPSADGLLTNGRKPQHRAMTPLRPGGRSSLVGTSRSWGPSPCDGSVGHPEREFHVLLPERTSRTVHWSRESGQYKSQLQIGRASCRERV